MKAICFLILLRCESNQKVEMLQRVMRSHYPYALRDVFQIQLILCKQIQQSVEEDLKENPHVCIGVYKTYICDVYIETEHKYFDIYTHAFIK